MADKGWTAFDFDKTIATYDRWRGHTHCGQPIWLMIDLMKAKIAAGQKLRILTARVSGDPQEAKEATVAIQNWLVEHGLPRLPITCIKDYDMIELYDDRAVQVEANTGKIIGYSTRTWATPVHNAHAEAEDTEEETQG